VSPIETIAELFAGQGMQAYLGEPVSLAQHMLQAAAQAEQEGAPDTLIAAALLHDLGHVLPDGATGDHHAERGADWLAQWFPESVTMPVRLHVEAKRYLCATEPWYLASLSRASSQSLLVQGGVMTSREVNAFKGLPYSQQALAVRRWDEAAKNPAASPPPFDHFRPLLERVLSSSL